ncbi:dipeptidase [Streptomyces sp. NPDC048436]|uniref:dipeptidase n=1 Tax=Streptomyces sp. NPDC048436 TaxID=3365550 RepID=UPI00372378CA
MADLQVELTAPAEAGDLDHPSVPEPPPIPEPVHDTAPGPGAALEELLIEPEQQLPDALSRAHALLAEHPVADGYSGMPWALRELPWYDLELGDSAVDADVPRLRAGGVGAQFWSVHVPEGLAADRALSATIDQIDLVKSVVDGHDEGLRLACSASQTADARHCGRIATLIGPARGEAIGESLAVLRALHALGVCSLTLSGTSWASPLGLSQFGEEVVRELNRLGVLAELTGAHEATVRRVLAVSKAPVLFTRSGARALRDTPENLPDDLLVAVGAAKGLCLVPLAAEQTGSSIQEVADHLEHVRRLAGPQCVGLSGMYDTSAAHPEGLSDPSGYPHLIAALIDRGWTDADLADLTWGNVQRVLRGAAFAAQATREREQRRRMAG